MSLLGIVAANRLSGSQQSSRFRMVDQCIGILEGLQDFVVAKMKSANSRIGDGQIEQLHSESTTAVQFLCVPVFCQIPRCSISEHDFTVTKRTRSSNRRRARKR